jgi:tetratricopeptide (TPR) repeat protein
MIRSIFLSLLLTGFGVASATSIVVKNFDSAVHRGSVLGQGLWAIEITPPKNHHFNLDAPHSAKTGTISFNAVVESPSKIIFQAESASLKPGTEVEATAFLCDEAKTYCLKKKVKIELNADQAKVMPQKFKSSSPTSVRDSKKSGAHPSPTTLHHEQDASAAVALAAKTGKPLLIHFYGIWCPPCNLYHETIFHSKAFKTYTQQFVFLRLDADAESSFALKSQFKIGGYPTLIVARVDQAGTLTEVERIVGYFPPKEFFAKLDRAYAHRADTEASRWNGREVERLQALWEQKSWDEIQKLTRTDLGPAAQLYRVFSEFKQNESFLKNPENFERSKKMLDALFSALGKLDAVTVLHAIDFLNNDFWLKQEQYLQMAGGFLNQLISRVDPATLYVRQSELSLPDLDALRMDLLETAQDLIGAAKARKQAIADYEKLIAIQAKNGLRDLRGVNLEYAALLTLDGRFDDAKKVYQRFIQKYPHEFTFYFASIKAHVLSKDLKKAREMAEKALQYSYGDNRIRAMERWVAVMGELGLKTEALKKAETFLKEIKIPEGLQVRTGRYVEALKKTMNKLNGEKESHGTTGS